MITQGSKGHPAILNDHVFGPIVKEVHWQSDVIAVLQLGEDPTSPVSGGDVISSESYASSFANFVGITAITESGVLWFTITDNFTGLVENRYTDLTRSSWLFNFKNGTIQEWEIYGMAVQDMLRRTGNSGFIFGTRPRFTYTAIPIISTIIVRGFRSTAVFTSHSDGTVSTPDSPLWSFTVSGSDCSGSNLFFSFDKKGRAS